MPSSNNKDKIERCGFCGNFFRGNDYIDDQEIANLPEDFISSIPLGYCPNANVESGADKEVRYVTRDMAIDAGDLSLEGQRI